MYQANLTVEVLTTPTDTDRIVAAINDLPTTSPHLGATTGFLCTLASRPSRHFPEIVWIVLTDVHGVAAILPMRRSIERKLGVAVNCLQSLNRFSMLYADARIRSDISGRAVRSAIMNARLFGNALCDVVRASDFSTESGFWPILSEGAGSELEDCGGASLVAIRDASLNPVFGPSKNLRKQLRQAAENLLKFGKAETKVSTSSDDLLAAFARFCALEYRGYKAGLDPLAADIEEKELVCAALIAQARSYGAHILELWVGSTVVASQLVFCSGHGAHLLRVAYDEEYADASPGTLLLSRLIEWCLEGSDIRTIDFIVQQEWHQRWHPHVRRHFRATWTNRNTLKGLALSTKRNIVRRLP